MGQFFLAIAAMFAGLSVGAGAFAAHALQEKLTERSLEIFETGALKSHLLFVICY
jgi:uncharacterized membrane protein YgdD (TMEM256/DUF423 family)